MRAEGFKEVTPKLELFKEEFQREKMRKELAAAKEGTGRDPKGRQEATLRVVPQKEAEKLVNSGWKYVGVIPNKVVIAFIPNKHFHRIPCR